MWVMLAEAGFFSVVQDKDDPDRLAVRARVRDDLVRLRRLYLPGIEIHEGLGTDYAYRAFTTREAWASAVASAARAISFDNFKQRTAKVMGGSRASIYAEVWSVLRRLGPFSGGGD